MPREITPIKMTIRSMARKLAKVTRARRPMMFPTYPDHVVKRIERYHDDVRYATLALALQRIESDGIKGAIAEVGVTRARQAFSSISSVRSEPCTCLIRSRASIARIWEVMPMNGSRTRRLPQ